MQVLKKIASFFACRIASGMGVCWQIFDDESREKNAHKLQLAGQTFKLIKEGKEREVQRKKR